MYHGCSSKVVPVIFLFFLNAVDREGWEELEVMNRFHQAREGPVSKEALSSKPSAPTTASTAFQRPAQCEGDCEDGANLTKKMKFCPFCGGKLQLE